MLLYIKVLGFWANQVVGSSSHAIRTKDDARGGPTKMCQERDECTPPGPSPIVTHLGGYFALRFRFRHASQQIKAIHTQSFLDQYFVKLSL